MIKKLAMFVGIVSVVILTMYNVLFDISDNYDIALEEDFNNTVKFRQRINESVNLGLGVSDDLINSSRAGEDDATQGTKTGSLKTIFDTVMTLPGNLIGGTQAIITDFSIFLQKRFNLDPIYLYTAMFIVIAAMITFFVQFIKSFFS